MRLSLAAFVLAPSLAYGNCTDDAMLVFDASGSMAEMGYNGLDHPRITEARIAMRKALPDITPVRRVGLVVYGPGDSEVCSHVDLRLPPRPDAADQIIAEIDALTPDGNTALTEAVQYAADALDARTKPATIVLVTDGKETCGGATCQLAAHLTSQAPGLTIHVIGFRVRGEHFNFEGFDSNPDFEAVPAAVQCLSDQTGGLYIGAESIEELVDAMHKTLGCPLFSKDMYRRPVTPG
ncbi:VWA domain-containing protein [Primorskyibacter aestuariivivens]|uniref:vWA domain-containing protein n=1 Tax=Primorskyibacter aestuariivivens TaxID=1888912 RepID=UPI002300321F|nr:vWA domain-containing protein [Primorskyibacter aestuariivivens]MDA7429436.1 VWA domain-containing protein [Primorskyibacter aestuariivivens]